MAKEKVRKSRGLDLEDVPPITEGRRFDAELETFNFSESAHTQIRLIGKVYPVKMHWVPTIKKDGSRSQFPKLCLHNDEEGERCPYCDIGLSTNTRYLSNAIIRDLEEARPKKAKYSKKAKYKKPGDDNWTPVRVVSFPASVMQKILNFKSLTKIKTKNGIETFHVSHPKYGRDLNVKLDTSGTGSGMYDVQREAVSRLEGEELEYLTYDIDSVFDSVETEDEAIQIIKSCFERGTFEGAKTKDGKYIVNMSAVQDLLGVKKKKRRDEDDDEDDEDDVPSSKRKKSSKKKSRRDEYDEDDDEVMDDDDLEDDEDEDDEDDRKSKKKKSKKSSKKKSRRDDEDDDLDDDEDEDDEDDEDDRKSSKKKSKPKKSSKKSRRDADDDDDDDDLDDDEDEDDEDEDERSSKKRSSKKKSSKKSRRDDDDEEDEEDDLDDDLDDDEDDDDEDDRKSKKSKKSSKKASKKSRRDEDDDDDDDDLELDDDEDEDDEDDDDDRKSRKKKPSKKSKR